MKPLLATFSICWSLLTACLIADDQDRRDLQRIAGAFDSILGDLDPKAEVRYPDGTRSVVISHRTQDFKIHGRSMTGEISPRAHDRIGPGFQGFILTARLQDRGEVNQAVTPQTLQEPYWQTLLDVTPLHGTDKQVFWSLAHGSRVDQGLFSGIQKVLNGFRDAKPPTVAPPETGREPDSGPEASSSLVSFDSPDLQTREFLSSQWRDLPVEKKREVQNFLLLHLGLSSTGKVRLVGVYRNPRKEGKEEKLFHFQQLDLMGSRLFWSVLVDPDASTALVLYRSGHEVNGKATPLSPESAPGSGP